MPAILYAIVTVLAWGTWISPAQTIPFKNQQIRIFYVAAANLVLATVVFFIQGAAGLTPKVFWLSFLGGVIWAVSGYLAFTGTKNLGTARAFGIWSPLNVAVSMILGAVIFGELIAFEPRTLALLGVSVIILVAGILMIIFAKGADRQSLSPGTFWPGLLGALGAGVLWGSYFVPVKVAGASQWVASFPLAIGIFAASTVLVLLTRQPIRLNTSGEYIRVALSGMLWGIGNYAMLLLVGELGAGRGFTIAQLGIIVNGLIGIYILKDPAPKSRAAVLTLIGCALAGLGGILLGSLQ
ncbi:MAG TPA: GRP family sugar transporter [Anaerolineaceae bacterium]|nr:GRP family sugar transporter [Anaerolineaceae bacterium]HQH86304.1 GRP family sugar transporter [Anaerolineaceae bacterium]